jgi:hypothetical protein
VIGESESQDDRRRDAFDRLWNLDFGLWTCHQVPQ